MPGFLKENCEHGRNIHHQEGFEMRRLWFGHAAFVLTLIGSFTACSSGGGGSSPSIPTASMLERQQAIALAVDASSKPPEVFVSQLDNPAEVSIFSPAGKKAGSIVFHVSPDEIYGGLATDQQRDLYVGVRQDVDVFQADYKGSPALLDGTGQGYSLLAVDQKLGTVAAAAFHCCSDSRIVLWTSRSSAICKKLGSDSVFGIFGVAFDADDNLFVTALDEDGNAHILEAAGGCAANKLTELSTANSFGSGIGGVAVNASNQIVVTDSVGNLHTYAQPVSGSLGAPVKQTTVADGGRNFTFTADGTSIWMIGRKSVAEYAYPAGGAPISSIGQLHGDGQAADIAVVPALAP